MSDKELETRIVVSFSKFGSCAAKVMRSQSGIPHCFVQYTTQDDADKAFAQGKGIQIGNRLCRVERSDANRKFIILAVAMS